MLLRDFLKLLKPDERESFFTALGRHPNYIRSLANGSHAFGKPRKPSLELAMAIQKHSDGKVKAWELLPHVFGKTAAPKKAAAKKKQNGKTTRRAQDRRA